MVLKLGDMIFSLKNEYHQEILDIFDLYYCSGLCTQKIAKYVHKSKDQVLNILTSNQELAHAYKEYNRIKFEEYHKKDGIPKLKGDFK